MDNEDVHFEVMKSSEGNYNAFWREKNVSTEAKTLEELYKNIQDTLNLHFHKSEKPDPNNVKLLLFEEK